MKNSMYRYLYSTVHTYIPVLHGFHFEKIHVQCTRSMYKSTAKHGKSMDSVDVDLSMDFENPWKSMDKSTLYAWISVHGLHHTATSAQYSDW